MNAFIREVDAVVEVVEELYQRSKKKFGGLKKIIKDFEDLAEAIMPKKWVKERQTINSDPDEIQWNKLKYRDPVNTFVEKNNRTYTVEIKNTSQKLKEIKEKLHTMYGYQNPVERVVVEERVNLLEKQFNKFIYEINPHHLQPGLLLDIDISTNKRKQYMMKAMANVLNEFLHSVSKGFADAAFATFKRRRSTVRDDREMSFEADSEADAQMRKLASQYSAPQSSIEETSSVSNNIPSGNSVTSSDSGVKGSADVTPKSYEDKLKDMGLKEL
jgi:hypothetical protein